MTTPKSKVNNIIDLYHRNGNSEYDIGEKVTQTEHGLQAALSAEEKGYDNETIIAALLHDIGHLLDSPDRMGDLGVMHHEDVGADHLKQLGFPEKVVALVRSHVDTKRYLVTTDVTYRNKLSDASKQTMEYQGGMMSDYEVNEFKSDKYFGDYVKFRELDEIAKVEGMKTRTLESYCDMMVEMLK